MQLNINVLLFFFPFFFPCSLRELLLQLLMKEVMDPDSNAPKGIKFHFIDIYLQELAKVGAKEVRKCTAFRINVNIAWRTLTGIHFFYIIYV